MTLGTSTARLLGVPLLAAGAGLAATLALHSIVATCVAGSGLAAGGTYALARGADDRGAGLWAVSSATVTTALLIGGWAWLQWFAQGWADK